MLRARERWTPLECSQFKINLKDVTEAYGHHKHNAEEHLFLDGTLPLLPVCLLWSLATHWWGIRKSLRNTNSRMAQSQPTPDCICVFIHSLVGVEKKQNFFCIGYWLYLHFKIRFSLSVFLSLSLFPLRRFSLVQKKYEKLQLNLLFERSARRQYLVMIIRIKKIAVE